MRTLPEDAADCVYGLLTTKTSHKALPMPRYYREATMASMNNLHDFSIGLMSLVMTENKKTNLDPDWSREWNDISDRNWQTKFITHMWNVLNDPFRIYSSKTDAYASRKSQNIFTTAYQTFFAEFMT